MLPVPWSTSTRQTKVPFARSFQEAAVVITRFRAVQAKLTNMLAGSKATSEKMQKEFSQLNDRVSKLQADLVEQIHQNTELLAENGQKQLSIKSKDEEIAVVKADTQQIAKLRDQTVKKLKGLEEAKADIESQRDALKQGQLLSL
jgi:predicted nuclease with TOPRIM domain